MIFKHLDPGARSFGDRMSDGCQGSGPLCRRPAYQLPIADRCSAAPVASGSPHASTIPALWNTVCAQQRDGAGALALQSTVGGTRNHRGDTGDRRIEKLEPTTIQIQSANHSFIQSINQYTAPTTVVPTTCRFCCWHSRRRTPGLRLSGTPENQLNPKQICDDGEIKTMLRRDHGCCSFCSPSCSGA